MLGQDEMILTREAPVRSLEEYLARGGGQAFEIAQRSEPEEIIDLIQRAGLRGRGGAGFATAIKWQGVHTSPASRKFVCCNGAEGEPGTFKDRYLLRRNPYQVLEGLAIAAQVIGAERAFMCVKENAQAQVAALQRALEELGSQTQIADRIELVLGPDEYLFGEEKALLEVVEGGLPLPRWFPPRIHGLFGGAVGGPSEDDNNPVVVNNVETLAHVPHIIRQGPESFRQLGTDDTPGTMVFTVSGDVLRPIVQELALGVTLRSLIYDVAGGLAPGRQVKAVLPGVANAVITESQLDVPVGFDTMRKSGSALGAGGFIVYDDTVCMVKVAETLSHFLFIESCNQCPPCKIGCRQITGLLGHILAGGATLHHIGRILQETHSVESGHRCYLPTSESLVISSIVEVFRDDFITHISGACDLRHDIILPKITDYVEGQGFTYDLHYQRKQPDWSYSTP